MLLRAEGIASSNIEGIRAPVEAVAATQLGGSGGPAGWVADNLAVIEQVLQDRHSKFSLEVLNAWHRRLMVDSTLPPEMVGAVRQRQNWIGGRSPREAVFVPAPPAYLPALMEDLVAFCSRDDLDPVVQAALGHAQFETIHPYGDGNGRVGRALVLWILARRLDVAVPPPMSTIIARDIGGYLSGLHWYRSGEKDRWVSWFAGVLEHSATASLVWILDVERTVNGWRAAVGGLRSDAAARGIVEILPSFPVISSQEVSRRLGISMTAARTGLEALAGRGIVSPYVHRTPAPGRPIRYWAVTDLIDLLNNWIG
ncbi:MAG: Fic family protein [Actinomycetota bacterium]